MGIIQDFLSKKDTIKETEILEDSLEIANTNKTEPTISEM